MNAVEAMSGGASRELLVATSYDGSSCIRVATQDSGPGLRPESFERLFDAFYTTKGSGMGMGLSICRSIVEAHGGQIWPSRIAGPGATFQFTLPVVAVHSTGIDVPESSISPLAAGQPAADHQEASAL
jgi:signal transduction histidine kinase